MWIIIALLILAAICFGLGFIVKWLFIAAVIFLIIAIVRHFAART